MDLLLYIHIGNLFLQDSISEHERTRVADEPARDFIDAYLNEKEKNECSNCTATHNFTVNQLLVIIRDLFGAGFETTTNSIGFAILHLIDHPEIQVKLQTELDTVCGDSNPTLTQRSRYIFSLNLLTASRCQ